MQIGRKRSLRASLLEDTYSCALEVSFHEDRRGKQLWISSPKKRSSSLSILYSRTDVNKRLFNINGKVLAKGEVDRLFAVQIGNNMGCIWDAYKLIASNLWNHVHFKYQCLADHGQNGSVDGYSVPTNGMIADILTKNLKRVKVSQIMKLTNLG